ncbi:hypothetical protein L195_g055826 [Trifolium pratense]|uniref:Cysteine-rich receptor-like protein kinase n=1 Tax=Trifolium pratense TaxID=57577 RepID=A0A2K3KNC9_TRIPR|nr:hypothetical protein L195_g055826 [Trifolium pratense]
MWFRVLAARYGIEGGRLRDGGRRGSSWWRKIARIRDGGSEIGGKWVPILARLVLGRPLW